MARAPISLIPLIVACSLFMEQLDSTIIATALPTIARDIGVDGLVCSAEEVTKLRDIAGPGMALVTPGIRPAGEPDYLLSSFINGIKHLPCEFG